MDDSGTDNAMKGASAAPAPSPPRFWWLKRLTAVFAIFIGAVIAFDAWWSHEADRRFNAIIAAIRARGEPAIPEDFDVAGVPDSQNAALTLSNAAASLSPNDTAGALLDAHDDEFTDVWASKAVKDALATDAQALALARQARSQSRVDWKIQVRSPVMLQTWPHLNPQRELARLLKVSVRYNHATGNDREALEAVRDMLNQSHVLGRGPSGLIVHLVSLGPEALACDAIERIAPDLRVEGNGPTTMPAATRQQIRDLIAELSDDARFSADAQRGWQGERMSVLDSTRYYFLGGVLPASNGMYWARPAMELDGVRSAGDVDHCAAADAQPNWPAAQSMLPLERGVQSAQIEQLLGFMSGIFRPGLTRGVEQDFHALVDRRAAVLRLAIHLYKTDHGGGYPKTLSELVPIYLPAIPVDPYAAGGRPISWRAGDPFPAVWSVGVNGIDDGGTSLPKDDQSNTPPFSRFECADIVYPLERMLSATHPSPQAEDGK